MSHTPRVYSLTGRDGSAPGTRVLALADDDGQYFVICDCRTCMGDNLCDQMRSELANHRQRRALEHLTEEDRRWLRAHGWNG